jgi:hypothetical protein
MGWQSGGGGTKTQTKFSNSSCIVLTQFRSDKACPTSWGSKEAINAE